MASKLNNSENIQYKYSQYPISQQSLMQNKDLMGVTPCAFALMNIWEHSSIMVMFLILQAKHWFVYVESIYILPLSKMDLKKFMVKDVYWENQSQGNTDQA